MENQQLQRTWRGRATSILLSCKNSEPNPSPNNFFDRVSFCSPGRPRTCDPHVSGITYTHHHAQHKNPIHSPVPGHSPPCTSTCGCPASPREYQVLQGCLEKFGELMIAGSGKHTLPSSPGAGGEVGGQGEVRSNRFTRYRPGWGQVWRSGTGLMDGSGVQMQFGKNPFPSAHDPHQRAQPRGRAGAILRAPCIDRKGELKS
jgi:hypothetical protein